jgi:hypothetical protein
VARLAGAPPAAAANAAAAAVLGRLRANGFSVCDPELRPRGIEWDTSVPEEPEGQEAAAGAYPLFVCSRRARPSRRARLRAALTFSPRSL